MNKQQYEVNNLPTQIVIGHQTETGVTSIYFDCTSWLASWPDLVLGVWVTQPGGTAAYPAATHMEGDVLVWDVTDSDTAVPGTGTMEIVGITTGKKKLSAIAKTKIMPTTTGTTTTPPEGEKAWVDAVIQAAGDAETSKSQAATYAQNAAASAEKAEENAKSVTWETLSGKPSTFPPDSHTHTLESLGAASAESVNQLKDDLTAEHTARANADQALANDIGDAWASGTTYAVGDYCISGNRLYKCKTAHTAGSAFNANYWDAVNMAVEVKNKLGSNHLARMIFRSQSTYKISLYSLSYNDAAIIFGCGGDGQGILITYGNGFIGILYKPSNVEVTAPSSNDDYMSFTIKNNYNSSESGFLGVIAINNNVSITEL